MEDRNLPRRDDPALWQPPELEFLCSSELSVVDISDVEALAPGRRVALQIEPGSRIDGPAIQAHFMPGGTFVQMGRADNVIEVEGRFVLETDDGHHIVARSTGLLSIPPDIAAALAMGEPYDPATLYARAAIVFEAAERSPYAWLNRGLYVVRTEWTGARAFSTLWRVM